MIGRQANGQQELDGHKGLNLPLPAGAPWPTASPGFLPL